MTNHPHVSMGDPDKVGGREENPPLQVVDHGMKLDSAAGDFLHRSFIGICTQHDP